LSWNDSPGKLYRSTDPNFSADDNSHILRGDDENTKMSYEDTGLQPDTTYYYILVPSDSNYTQGSANAKTKKNDNKYSILVERLGASSYSGSATVAAGGGGTDAHKASIQIKVTDANDNPLPGVSIQAPKITGGDGHDGDGVNASIGSDSVTTDDKGIGLLTFTSSDKLGDVTLTLNEDSSQSATISQEWDKGNGDWGDTPDSFEVGTLMLLEFKPKLGDGNPKPEIKGHQLEFIITQMTIEVWSEEKGKWEKRKLNASNTADNALIHLYTKVGGVASDSGGGDYKSSVTVTEDDQHQVDDISYDVVDDTDWN